MSRLMYSDISKVLHRKMQYLLPLKEQNLNYIYPCHKAPEFPRQKLRLCSLSLGHGHLSPKDNLEIITEQEFFLVVSRLSLTFCVLSKSLS